MKPIEIRFNNATMFFDVTRGFEKFGEYVLESEAYDVARTKQREWAYGEGNGERLAIRQYVANGNYIEL